MPLTKAGRGHDGGDIPRPWAGPSRAHRLSTSHRSSGCPGEPLRPPHQRQAPLPKRERASDEILPEPRLRLVHAKRSRLAGRKSERIGPQALFVKPMTGLVEHAEQGGGKIRLVPARGESAVVWPGSATKRVLRGVDPPTGEVEADFLRHYPDERFLGCAGKMLPQQVVPRRAARSTPAGHRCRPARSPPPAGWAVGAASGGRGEGEKR